MGRPKGSKNALVSSNTVSGNNATMTATTVKGNTMDIKKTYKYFDLDSFEEKFEDKVIPFEAAKTTAEASERVGTDDAVILKALNAYLKAEALRKAELEVTAKGGKKSVVLAIAKPFRALPPFNAIFELDSNGKPKIEDGEKVVNRKAQTAAILNMIKGVPAMLEAIRAGSSVATEDEDDSTESED